MTNTKKKGVNPRSEQSVQNAITILTNATQNRLSLSAASKREGFGRNYVSDVKANVRENLDNKNIKRDQYRTFRNLLKEYNSL